MTIRAKNEKGANLVEYALLIALIFLVAIAATRFFSTRASGQFSFVSSTITGVM